jgi:glycosyltransferase involved in cell wall biosynthesis
VPEVVGDAALLVPVAEDLALAGALRVALDDEGERTRLIAAGRRRTQTFSWERCATELAQLYVALDARRKS